MLYLQVYVGIVGAFITIPVNVILVGLFKTIDPHPSSKNSKRKIGNIEISSSESSASDEEDTEFNSHHGGEELEMHRFHDASTSPNRGLVTGIKNFR